MHINRKTRFFPLIVILLLCSITLMPAIAAPTFANTPFQNLWQYSDKLVDEIPGAGRGFTWGPNSFGILQENYQEGAGGKRQVQYFDKSRMELSANGQSVTNGLLTKELVTGQRQDGDNTFTTLTASTVQVAGDDNSGGGNAISPTYASFKNVVSFNPGENRADNRLNGPVNLVIDKAGNVTNLPIGQGTATIQTTIADYQDVLGHNIPRAFYDFANQTARIWNGNAYVIGKVFTDNPIANVFGYAITEPYWMKAVVAGEQKDIMVQLYERRVLTYTPSNPPAFQVEMGNIGQHYYKWRYGQSTPIPTPTPTPPPANNSASCTADKPAVSSNLTINASLALPNVSGGNQTLCLAANKNGQPVSGATVSFSVAYKSVTKNFDGNPTGADGKSTTSWDVGGPTKGFEIKVTVKVTFGSETATTIVSWTPA